MDPLLVGVISGLVGLMLGVFGVLAFRASEHQRTLVDDALDEPGFPEGSAEVLSVLGRAFVIVDDIDGVVRASPAAYAFGLVRGHTVVHQQLLDMTSKVRRDGVVLEQEFELPRGPLGAGTIIVQVRAAVLGDEYVLLLADDRTEITRTEEIRNDFVANVSHELKTPVGAISLLAEALEDSSDDEEVVRRFAQRMRKEAARLAALVQDIIELSRLQGANVATDGHEIAVRDVVADAVDRSKLAAEAKNITVVVGNHAQDATVFGDQDLLITALRNLIDNAIRYSPENTRVGIGVRSREGIVAISVTDQGDGLSPEDQERIFERFYRVDAARSRQTGGTGLGLSIVKHVLSNHGGEVSVWSQVGQGSTFTIRLPEMEAHELAAAVPEDFAVPTEAHDGGEPTGRPGPAGVVRGEVLSSNATRTTTPAGAGTHSEHLLDKEGKA